MLTSTKANPVQTSEIKSSEGLKISEHRIRNETLPNECGNIRTGSEETLSELGRTRELHSKNALAIGMDVNCIASVSYTHLRAHGK